jgi:hypothetical protein
MGSPAVAATPTAFEQGDLWTANSSLSKEYAPISLEVNRAGQLEVFTQTSFPVRCTGKKKINASFAEGEVVAAIRPDGTFKLSRTLRFYTRATGSATARETFEGKLLGARARLTFTTRVKGKNTTCRKTARWSLKDPSV